MGDKGSKFYNTTIKSQLQENDKEMCSIQSEVKSVVDERLTRTLKNKNSIDVKYI